MLQQLVAVLLVLGAQDQGAESKALGAKLKKSGLAKLGTKVGDGECFAFVKTILEDNGCKTALDYEDGSWGDPVKAEDVQVGDVIQLQDVKIAFKKGNKTFNANFPKHTQLVIEAPGKGKFVVLEQNTDFGDVADPKVVQKHTFDVKSVTAGKVTFYRPVKK